MMVKIRSGNARFMEPVCKAVSACRHCRFYCLEGRRGGYCEQLGVPVQGGWRACTLATAPFVSKRDQRPGIEVWTSNADPQLPISAEVSFATITLSEAELASSKAEVIALDEVGLLSVT